ncbi:MAG: PQQ-binding-like beta-propeller repeat protein, partial [Candidatus Neomarinimicrobiota bacterium]
MPTIRSGVARLILLGLACLGMACGDRPRFSPGEPVVFPAIDRGRPELSWEIKLPSPVSELQALDSQALLVATHRGELFRLNLDTGKRDSRIWQPTRDAINSLAVADSTNTLFFANAQRRELWAYDLERGKFRWKFKGSAISGAMTVYRNLLVTTGTEGGIKAFDIEDGNLLWQRTVRGRIYCDALLWSD